MVDALAHQLRVELALDVDLRDLKSDGMTGLIEAADRFDPARGSSFGGFAYRRVHGAMVDGLRRMGRLSRRAHDRCKRTAAMLAALEQEADARGETGEAGALTQPAGEPAPDRAAFAMAFEEIVGRVAASFVATAAEQEHGKTPEEALMTADELATVRRAVDELEPREQRVVRGVFFEERRHDDLAAELGVTRTEGLEGAALEAEVDAWVERAIDRHARAAPEALREELRRGLRAMLETDPVLGTVVRGMKTAAG